MDDLLRLSPADNVAVALRDLAAGEAARLGLAVHLTAEAIPFAHKLALEALASGAVVRKFGVPIGRTTAAVAAGALVHVHNIESAYVNNALEHAED